jgi:hypothetical protein
MELLTRPPVIGSSTGAAGVNMPASAASTPSSTICRLSKRKSSSLDRFLQSRTSILRFDGHDSTYGHLQDHPLAGEPSSIYCEEGKYKVSIERMVEGYCHLDPPTTTQLAVPVAIPNACFTKCMDSSDPITRAAGCLILVSFYFLLQVGEYTKPKQAGGTMALKLHGYNHTNIMKMGRLTSLTFLQYIHNQIAHLSDDTSKKMSEPLPFLNIAAIKGTL